MGCRFAPISEIWFAATHGAALGFDDKAVQATKLPAIFASIISKTAMARGMSAFFSS
jgi:hypothetical protein